MSCKTTFFTRIRHSSSRKKILHTIHDANYFSLSFYSWRAFSFIFNSVLFFCSVTSSFIPFLPLNIARNACVPFFSVSSLAPSLASFFVLRFRREFVRLYMVCNASCILFHIFGAWRECCLPGASWLSRCATRGKESNFRRKRILWMKLSRRNVCEVHFQNNILGRSKPR